MENERIENGGVKMEKEQYSMDLENDVSKSLCGDCDILVKEGSVVVDTDLSGINFSYIENLRRMLKEKY